MPRLLVVVVKILGEPQSSLALTKLPPGTWYYSTGLTYMQAGCLCCCDQNVVSDMCLVLQYDSQCPMVIRFVLKDYVLIIKKL